MYAEVESSGELNTHGDGKSSASPGEINSALGLLGFKKWSELEPGKPIRL